MIPLIEVTNPGLFTTVQDKGRFGYQAFGLPVAGAMDDYAYRIVNMLVCNPPDAAVLEMTLFGGVFTFSSDCYAAICGADMQAELNGQPFPSWTSAFVPAGSTVAFKNVLAGCRTYLAVSGGVDTQPVMGSRSTFTRGVLGGHEGRVLKAGDKLPAGKPAKLPSGPIALPAEYIPKYEAAISIRVMLGPQDDLFTPEGIETLFSNEYTVTPDSDRMGCRLETGVQIKHVDKPDIVSDALSLGSIQVPGHGMPIIMMADRQTTGGYTKIATVIGADIWKMAQAIPGTKVRFSNVLDHEAQTAFHDRLAVFNKIKEFTEKY